MRSEGRAWLRSVVLALASMLVIALAIAAERRTQEHANRVHRQGDPSQAARLYGDRVAAYRVRGDTVSSALLYNFGTALLDAGSPVAEVELARVAVTEDATVRADALYNLGRWHLLRARDARASDSVRTQADLAIGANKQVLRLEPGHGDARWNLAIAQRMLDSVNAEAGSAGSETVDGASDSDERALSEDLREFESDSEVTDAPREGSDEALAQGQEVAPLSAVEAAGILVTDSDRTVIVRKLLRYEGRVSRRVRAGRTTPRW
jgi:hypothetical protein